MMMTINRRTALRQLALLSVGAALLPSCGSDHSKSAFLLKNFKIDNGQELLMEELAATLIPTTATPGAREVSAHLFTLKMLDDCYSRQDQEKFLKGMRQFDDAARSSAGKSFVAAAGPQRESLLQGIESGKIPGEELSFFYSTNKRLTILAYSSSAFFLTKVQVYELVPGRFHGCVPVQQQPKPAIARPS
jgi:Gluconate 2-dehydrogenase subunit 3